MFTGLRWLVGHRTTILLLGGIRSSAQMISYELAMGLSLLPVFLWVSVPGAGDSGLSISGIANFWKDLLGYF